MHPYALSYQLQIGAYRAWQVATVPCHFETSKLGASTSGDVPVSGGDETGATEGPRVGSRSRTEGYSRSNVTSWLRVISSPVHRLVKVTTA